SDVRISKRAAGYVSTSAAYISLSSVVRLAGLWQDAKRQLPAGGSQQLFLQPREGSLGQTHDQGDGPGMPDLEQLATGLGEQVACGTFMGIGQLAVDLHQGHRGHLLGLLQGL